MKQRTKRNQKNKAMKNFKRINLLVMIFAITLIFSFPKASEGEVITNAQGNTPENTQESQSLEVGTDEKEQKKEKSKEEKKEKKSSKPIAYLTVDDGPTGVTHELLNLLSEYNIKATFFMLEPKMKQHSDTLTRMVEEGHALGMHGVTHNKRVFYNSKESVVGEMDQGRKYIKQITATDPYLIRVPYGSHPHMTNAYKQAVKKAGFQMWDWNVDSKDWNYRDHRFVDSTIAQVQNLEQKNIDPVILIHDLPTTVNNLRPLLAFLSQYFEMETLNDIEEPLIFGSSTASNTAQITIPTFGITINGKTIDNQNSKYPFIIYNDITYLPLTWDYTQGLGIKITWDDQQKIDFSKTKASSSVLKQELGGNNIPGKAYSAQIARQKMSINEKKINNNKEEYPFLIYKDIIYLPLTWKHATEEFDLKIQWNPEKGLILKN